MDDGSLEEKEARLAALMHGGLDAHLRSLHESVRKRELVPVADFSVLSAAIAGLYLLSGTAACLNHSVIASAVFLGQCRLAGKAVR